MRVVTRFPPSPTGYFHIGSARTALFNYLFTAHHGGTMYLRFEDTDKARSKKEYEEDILAGLAWLKIAYTLPQPFRQSERTDSYKTALKTLFDKDQAYISKEPAKEDPSKEVSVVRLKNPGKSITFQDLIRGDVTFNTAELGDFVIARNIEEPLYNFTVVVDDAEMGVTHVIRGEDHISNTARQILILESLGHTRPQYAHIPLILAPDRSKLSKRHSAVSVGEYKKEGFVPEAIINYLALLGWNPGGDQEIFSIEQIINKFDLKDVQKGGAIFDVEKLKWFNHEHLRVLSDDGWARTFRDFSGRSEAEVHALPIPLMKERSRTLAEAKDLIEGGELGFLVERISYESQLLIEGAKTDKTTVAKHLGAVKELLESLSEFSAEKIKAAIFPYAEKEGKHQVLWPLRVALTGQKKSPDPFTVAAILGKERSISRAKDAIALLS